ARDDPHTPISKGRQIFNCYGIVSDAVQVRLQFQRVDAACRWMRWCRAWVGERQDRGVRSGDVIESNSGQLIKVFAAGAEVRFAADDRNEWIDYISADSVVSLKIGERDTAIAVYVEIAERALQSLLSFKMVNYLHEVLRTLQNQIEEDGHRVVAKVR